MVPTPKSGVNKNPASKAPITPTTMLRNTPCCASVPIMRLAIHPRMPPMMSHKMKFIFPHPFCGVLRVFALLDPPCLTVYQPRVIRLLSRHLAGLLFQACMQMSYLVDHNSAYSLISRERFFCVLHFERNHGFGSGS